MNARFWVYLHGSAVKLTLRPGQTMNHCYGGPTEEGWHSEATQWHLAADEPVVYRQWCSDGRDCDGRLTHSGSDFCPLNLLRANEPYGIDDPLVRWPAWEEDAPTSRYDEYAAMAGY